MPRSTALILLPASLLALSLAACDRPPRGAAKPATGKPAIEAGAVTTPVSPGTVALSGAISDMPASTTPDASSLPAKPAGAATAPGRTVRPPSAVGGVAESTVPARGETAAMREFREAQERRDRELLERDMDEARSGSTDGATHAATPPQDEMPVDDEALPPGGYDDEDLPPVAYDDEPPLDGEELPMDDEELPLDDEALPPEDHGDLRWDPATGTWR